MPFESRDKYLIHIGYPKRDYHPKTTEKIFVEFCKIKITHWKREIMTQGIKSLKLQVIISVCCW